MKADVFYYIGKIERYWDTQRYLVELVSKETGVKGLEHISVDLLNHEGIDLDNPYFELCETVKCGYTPKEFGGMEQIVSRIRKYIKISSVAQKIKERRGQIRSIEKEIQELQGQCVHVFKFLSSGNDSDGWSVNVDVTTHSHYICEDCEKRRTVSITHNHLGKLVKEEISER